MDITPYVESLRRDLAAAAESGDEQIRAAAERLAFAIDPAARLALMEALSDAAAEITAEMPSGGVEVRLAGRELEFVVDAPAAPTPPTPPTPPAAPRASSAGGPGTEEEESDNLARITLRLPESVKTRAEQLAGRAGISLNTWLVSVLRGATSEQGAQVTVDLSSIPFAGSHPPDGPSRGSRRMTGWI